MLNQKRVKYLQVIFFIIFFATVIPSIFDWTDSKWVRSGADLSFAFLVYFWGWHDGFKKKPCCLKEGKETKL